MDLGLTLVVLVVDRSGSMANIREDMEGGINELLKAQREVSGRAVVSVYRFDDVVETVEEMKAIGEVGRFVLEPRGSTALFDSAGFAIDRTGFLLSEMEEGARPGKVIVVMVTDGMENSSKRVTREGLLKRITRQRETYHWEFIYMGANQDAIAVGASIGVDEKFSMSYAATPGQVRSMNSKLSAQVRHMRGPMEASEMKDASGFSQEDRDDVAEPESGGGASLQTRSEKKGRGRERI